MSNKSKPITLKLTLKSYVLIALAFVASCITIFICFKPVISELAYRQAYFNSEFALKKPQYFYRYKYAIDEYEKATKHYPWEAQYAVMMNRDIERFLPLIKDKNEQIRVLNKAIKSYQIIQQLDPVNPWYYSRVSALQNRLAYVVKDEAPTLSRNLIKESSDNTRKASQSDFENPIFLENYANLLFFNQRITESLYYYQRCVEIDQRYFTSFMKMADIYRRLRYYDLALDALKKAQPFIFKALNSNKQSSNYFKAQNHNTINSDILELLIQTQNYDDALTFYNDFKSHQHTTIKFTGLAGYLFFKRENYFQSYKLLDYFYTESQDNTYIQLYVDLLVQVNPPDVTNKLEKLLSFNTLTTKDKLYLTKKLNALN